MAELIVTAHRSEENGGNNNQIQVRGRWRGKIHIRSEETSSCQIFKIVKIRPLFSHQAVLREDTDISSSEF